MTLSVDSEPQCERDNPPEDCEIETTQEMIDAGVRVYIGSSVYFEAEEDIVARIFTRMISVARSMGHMT